MNKTKLERYAAYKDSGVEWLGEIPEHWEVTIAKHVLRKLNRPRKKNGDTVICSNHGYSKLLGDIKQGLVSLTQHDYQGVNKGDLLVHGMDAWHGAIAISNHVGDCTSVVHVCDSKYNKTYIAYFLKMLAIFNIYKVISNGVRQNTSDFRSWQKFGDIQLILPPQEEQTRIANFLDDKCTKIDQAIQQKERLIELLQERKQIIIQNAVTRGLNPKVKKKDSGVDWIGEIPEGWKCLSFRYLINILTDYTANGSFGNLAKFVTYLDSPSYSRLIRLTDLRKNLTAKGVYLDVNSHNYLSKSELFGGELLMANVGAYAGLAWIMPTINTPASLAPNMFLIKPNTNNIQVKYLYYLINSIKYRDYIRVIARSAAQPKLNKDNIRQLSIVLPPIQDQNNIIAFVESQAKKFDKVINYQTQQIEKLKEYKQVLINEVVTGKVKV